MAVEVGIQVRRKADHRKAGLRTIAGVAGDSNPPVLAADLPSFRFQRSKFYETPKDVTNLGVGNIAAAAADRRSNPCWPCFNTVNVDDEKERVELGVALHKLISCTFLTLHEAYHGGVNSQPQ